MRSLLRGLLGLVGLVGARAQGQRVSYWTPFLPRERAEVWLFDDQHTRRRCALPRG